MCWRIHHHTTGHALQTEAVKAQRRVRFRHRGRQMLSMVHLTGEARFKPKTSTEQPMTVETGESETSFLISQGVVDAYVCMHSGRSADFDVQGWTWGFPSVRPKNNSFDTPVQYQAETGCNFQYKAQFSVQIQMLASHCDRRRIDCTLPVPLHARTKGPGSHP